ncbi:hypothetical protein CHCC20372_1114 [Bacillus paralicheniformis]|nr:hypothetical protein CHCC20372_1114 [Bacillus paralicheniformis]
MQVLKEWGRVACKRRLVRFYLRQTDGSCNKRRSAAFLTVRNVFPVLKNKFLRTSFIKNFNAYDTIEL